MFLFVFIFCKSNVCFAQCDSLSQTYPFLHGVASGDATQTHVILWTRLTVNSFVPEVSVFWVIGEDPELTNPLLSGTVQTGADRDFTVKLDAGPLKAGHWYYYRFFAHGAWSPVGRTHTLPEDGDQFSFAAFSCSNYEMGYFNAYRHVADENSVDAVFHMGDYYYEYTSASALPGRKHDPLHTLYSLEDYRRRHAQVCGDEAARELRRQYPWYTIWDDHEFANDACTSGAPGHDNSIMPWETRRENARQAYFEWMPIRDNPGNHLQRSFHAGDLLSLNFLDTRLEDRSPQAPSGSDLMDDSTQTIIGDLQFNKLVTDLNADPSTAWKLVFTSVMMNHLVNSSGQPLENDLWEGYRYERNRLWDSLSHYQIRNLVSFAGDFHSSWAGNLPLDGYDEETHTASLGCEFTVPAATSAVHTVGDIPTFISYNPNIEWIEQTRNGYLLCRVTDDSLLAGWKYLSTIQSPEFTVENGKTCIIRNGIPFVEVAGIDMPSDAERPPLAPVSGIEVLGVSGGLAEADIYPNPAGDGCFIHWSGRCGKHEWQLFSANGQRLADGEFFEEHSGPHYLYLNLSIFPQEILFLHVRTVNDESVFPILHISGNR